MDRRFTTHAINVSYRVPVGLEDVSKYPNLFAELIRRGYPDEDLQKIARLNLIRVFRGVEMVCTVMVLASLGSTQSTSFTVLILPKACFQQLKLP